MSGQFDAISYLSAASVAALKSHSAFIRRDLGHRRVLAVHDARGRSAVLRCAGPAGPAAGRRPSADAPEVFEGYGRIGNDMFGIVDPDFDHSLPQRVRDIPKAKSLLKAAGHPDLSVQLITSMLTGGVVQAAQVFATQAAEAGVNVTVSQQDPTRYYADSFLHAAFSQDNWEYAPYLLAAAQETVSGAPFNECHFDDPEYNSLYARAYTSTDPAVQRDVIHAMQRIDYERGGLIIPFFNPNIDAVASYVRGDIPNVTGFGLNAFDLRRFWLDK